MNKTTRLAIIITAAVLALVVIGILAWLMFQSSFATTTNSTNTKVTNGTITTTNSSVVTNDTNSTITNSEPTIGISVSLTEQQAITRVVTNFTERYGSYSTDTAQQNLAGLNDLMTETLASTINKQLSQQKLPDTFYSISTQVAHVDITEYAEGSTGATVTVVTRRTEKKGSVAPSTSLTQSARVQLKKVTGVWKVDTFKWL